MIDLAPCLFCRRDTARPADWDDHRLVAIRCQACGARGPLVVIQDAECREAATELAAELWGRAGRLEHFEYQLTAPVRIEALDRALLSQLLEHNALEPATDTSDDRPVDADGLCPGPTTAEANIGTDPTDGTQVPESAGGGEGAPKSISRASLGVEKGDTPPRKDNGARKPVTIKQRGPHPLAERIQAYLSWKECGATALSWPVSLATVYNVLKGHKVSDETITTLARHMDRVEGVSRSKADAGDVQVEVLPNRYDELNTGNPLPKYQAPTRCSRTP